MSAYKTTGSKSGGPSRRKAKTEATKKRIIDAARKVFSSYPYDAASIRMIGQEGGFNHSFIRYHFRTKAGLFEAVSQALIEEYFQASVKMIEGLDVGGLRENLDLLLDRFLDFGFENPDALDITMLNMGAVDNVKDAFPGMHYMRRFHEDILRLFTGSGYFKAPAGEVDIVFFCSSILVVNCIGASWFYGRLLEMDSRGEEYREWVRNMLAFLFYPILKRLVFPPSEEAPAPDYEKNRAGKRALAAPKKIMGLAKSVLARSPYSPSLKRFLAEIEKSTAKITKRKKPEQETKRETKGEATRRRIIGVARRVFTQYPYNAASIRMIGEEGGFDFTLLYHYFPKKAELFEAVVSELLEEFLGAAADVVKGLDRDTLRENVSAFINSTLDYCFDNPDLMRGSMQNIAQMDKFEDIPGFENLTVFLKDSLAMFRHFAPVDKSDERVRMWLYGFGSVAFNCVGAASYHAQVLGMDPEGRRYRQWVKDALMYVFYPSLKELLFSPRP